jgi:hypothetical protein
MADANDVEAIRAMRARGIDNPEDLLEHADAAAILATCQWWDGRKGVGPGLLAKKIREGGVVAGPAAAAGPLSLAEARLILSTAKRSKGRDGEWHLPKRSEKEWRQLFDPFAERFPPGSVTELHADLIERQHPEIAEPCDGHLVVAETIWPIIRAHCDECLKVFGYPVRTLHVLPDWPLGTCPVPREGGTGPSPDSPASGASLNGDVHGDELRRFPSSIDRA